MVVGACLSVKCLLPTAYYLESKLHPHFDAACLRGGCRSAEEG